MNSVLEIHIFSSQNISLTPLNTSLTGKESCCGRNIKGKVADEADEALADVKVLKRYLWQVHTFPH